MAKTAGATILLHGWQATASGKSRQPMVQHGLAGQEGGHDNDGSGNVIVQAADSIQCNERKRVADNSKLDKSGQRAAQVEWAAGDAR